MTNPTEKQIKFAKDLGIENPESFNAKALSDEIGKRTGNTKKSYQNGSKQARLVSQETIVRNVSDKPHSYEFGKPSKRHKIYYATVEELKTHIEILKSVGLCDCEDVAETIKPEEFVQGE